MVLQAEVKAETVGKEALEQANALAQKIQQEPEQLAVVLVNACMGRKPQLAGVPDALVTDRALSEQESHTRGLILTEDNIVNIKRYVAFGLKLPTTEEEVHRELGYTAELDEKTPPELSPKAFAELHRKIQEHCKKWSNLEYEIKTQGTALNIFGADFVDTSNSILEVIQAMPVYELVTTTLEAYAEKDAASYEFTIEDQKMQGGILELLAAVKEHAGKCQANAHDLAEKLAQYRAEMENEILPAVGRKDDAMTKRSKSDARAELIKKKEELDAEIKTLDKEYSKMVGYAFTGTAGLILGPLGIISWAVTGGVFGDKAEKVRKNRNERIAERQSILDRLSAEEHLLAFVAQTHERVASQALMLEDALTGVKNLEVMWDAVTQYLDNASREVEEMDNGASLLLFQRHMQAASSSWGEVRDITGELLTLFEQAQQRAKKLDIETKQ